MKAQLIKSYFQYRNTVLSNDCDRSELAEREIKTLETMLREHKLKSDLCGLKIADLACGDQHLKSRLVARGASYFGYDIYDCNLACEPIPADTDSFDICISLAFIEHILDPEHFLAEIKRVLKPQGILLVETPNINRCKEHF